MPRNYNTQTSGGGTNMVGRAYTPQVAPWDRSDDDVSVQRSLRDDSREWRDNRDDRSLDRDYRDRRDVRERNNATYYGRDLVPGYGEDYAGYPPGYRDWRDDDRRYRAERRARERDDRNTPRYQYNVYRPVSDDDYGGYRREGDRSGWMARDMTRDHDRDDRDHRQARYNDREPYYADAHERGDRYRNEEAMRGRWNRR